MPIDALIGGAFGLAEGAMVNQANLQMNRENNMWNERLMREGWNRDEQFMRESWAREDNAIARRVFDLERSGLSKTLAAGGAAASSAGVHSNPARMEAGRIESVADKAMLGLAIKQANANIDKTQADAENTRNATRIASEANERDERRYGQAERKLLSDISVQEQGIRRSEQEMQKMQQDIQHHQITYPLIQNTIQQELEILKVSARNAPESQRLDIQEKVNKLESMRHDIDYAKRNGLPVGIAATNSTVIWSIVDRIISYLERGSIEYSKEESPRGVIEHIYNNTNPFIKVDNSLFPRSN